MKAKNKAAYTSWIDLAKDIVHKVDIEHKKIHTVANELGMSESKVIMLYRVFTKE